MKQEYYFNKIIIGGSLESLLYSFISDTPILIKDPIVPFELDLIDDSYDLSFLGYDGSRDIYKSEVWDRLSFLLSMAGIVIFPNIISNIRHENKSFFITTTQKSRIKVKYNQLLDFDKVLDDEVSVYDWFDVRSGSVHRHKVIHDKQSDLVNKLFFYPSRRIGQTKMRKDVVAFSKIKSNELLNYSNSEAYARLKSLKMMKEAGIRGRSNGYNKKGTQLHYAVKIEHTHREVIKNYKPMHSIKQILKKSKRKGKLWNSAKKLFRHKETSTSQVSYQLPGYL